MQKGKIFLISALILMLVGCSDADRIIVSYGRHSFNVETARTFQQQTKGLMFRESLAPDSGMLFIFEKQGPKAFYMKNTYIPLDIIWIDKDKKVVFIKRNAKPDSGGSYETIHPQEDAMYVLELNAGTADKIGLNEGDRLSF